LEDKYLIMSDIHGNVSALEAVLSDCSTDEITSVILLGDCIDYGMRSNEVIRKLNDIESSAWKDRIIVNIWGNHEKLLRDRDLERLSSDRGRVMAGYTAKHLTDSSIEYINDKMECAGMKEFQIRGCNCLAVHGSLEDYYWKAIEPDNVKGDYREYDIVFSGHSHYSQCFTYFYNIDNPELRNKKAVMFINPGSVGQPRNRNPYAQYAVLHLPSKWVELRAVSYDVEYEQSLYNDEVDDFYRLRLTRGI